MSFLNLPIHPIRAAFDARFKALCRIEPRLVAHLHDLPPARANIAWLPVQGITSSHEMDAVVRYTKAELPHALILHIEFQSAADARMRQRMFVYWQILLAVCDASDQIHQLVLRVRRTTAMPSVLRLVPSTRSNLLVPVRALNDYSSEALLDLATAADDAIPLAATLVPGARNGARRDAIAASLRVLHAQRLERAWLIQLTALHRALAELNSKTPGLWREVAMSVCPEFTEIYDEDDAWFAAELEDAMRGHELRGEERGRAAGFQQGIEQGIEQGIAQRALAQREMLLRLAAAACAPELVASLEHITDVGELEARVIAALRR